MDARIHASVTLPCGKTIALDLQRENTADGIREAVHERYGIPIELQLVESLRTKGQDQTFEICGKLHQIYAFRVHLALRGGAAAKLKAEAERRLRLEAATEERKSWLVVADKTEETGVMRLLIESEVLYKHKVKVQGPVTKWYEDDKESESFSSEPASANYDDVNQNGFRRQDAYNKAFAKLAGEFFELWQLMTGGFQDLKSKVFPAAIISTDAPDTAIIPKEGKLFVTDKAKYRLIEAEGMDGLWYKGPKAVITEDDAGDEARTDFIQLAKDRNLWSAECNCWKSPWMTDPQNPDSDLERWIYVGIGTATYFMNEKKTSNNTIIELILWSQEDEDSSGVLGGLTDREKLRLKQKVQIEQKLLNKMELTSEEDDLRKNVIPALVEEGPLHKTDYGIYQWRIKSLIKQFRDSCVFRQNMEPDFSGGSIAKVNIDKVKVGGICKDSGYDVPPHPDVWQREADGYNEFMTKVIKGEGNEAFYFYKYGKPVGSIKKKHIREDRQRLLDAIEMFMPTYKAVIKNQGRPADENGDNNHQMLPKLMREITDVVALALDLNIPDYSEDKIACCIKTLVDERLGPTWHVLVGRSFGFSIQAEARHFLHMHMQHLAIVLWKYEPDPSPANQEVQSQA